MTWMESDDPHDVGIIKYCLEQRARGIEDAARFISQAKTIFSEHEGDPAWKESMQLWHQLLQNAWRIGERS